MGFLDAATDAANKASSALDSVTGGQKTGASSGKAEFVKGDLLTDKDAKQGGSAASAPDGTGNPVTFDFGIPTEFVHFGRVHPDTGKAFPHDNLNPDNAKPPLEGHGIMFRDALEREAILLFGFVSSCKTAVQDTTRQRGAAEEIGAMASSLFGSGNTTSKPDPTQLDTFTAKIKTEVGKINKAQILYPEIHECGKQLHTIRADYYAFCDSLDAYYLKPPKSEGIGAISDAIGSAAANIPEVGKILGVAQRIAFKFLDLYLAAFLELRKNHEKTIEIAVHKLTIEAIKGKYAKHAPVYPIWFKNHEKKDDVTVEKKDGKGSNNTVSTDQIVNKIAENEKVKNAKKTAEDVRDTIYDFAGASSAPEKTPGSPALTAAFAALKGGGDTNMDSPPSASDCIIKGLDATLSDIGGVPNFMKTVIREIMDGNIGLLENVFARLMANDAAAEINSQMLLAGGRKYLTDRISKAFSKLIFGVMTGGEDFTIGVPFGGKELSAQQMIGKQIDERLGKFIEPVLQMCIGDLAGQLEASRKKAADEKANTMEVYLGRLPWLTAMMFRNTFFPIWNLVAEEVMGEISPLKSALKAVNTPFEKAKDAIDKGQEYKRRAEEAKKQAEEVKDKASNVGIGTDKGLKDIDEIKKEAGDVQDATEIETEEGKRRKAEREAAQAEKDNLDKFYQANDKDKDFPVVGRVVEGEAIKVEDEVPSVLPETA